MPINEQYVRLLNRANILAYLPQLSLLDLARLDHIVVVAAITDPPSIRQQSRLRVLRQVILENRERLEELDVFDLMRDEEDMPDVVMERWSTPPVWQGAAYATASNTIHITTASDHTTPLSRIKQKKSWEFSFMEEEPVEEEELDWSEEKEEEKETELTREAVKTLKELASLLPPGVLGMQQDEYGQPYNLIFRAQAEGDPRKKLVKGDGWFEVKGEEAVLWAAATLENYNKLYDSGMEYKQSPKVKGWQGYITSLDPLAEIKYFGEDCPLFDYQKEAVQFLTRRRRAMLALSPGLGKSLAALYAATKLGHVTNVLLVCPASLLLTWYSEIAKWQKFLPKNIQAEIWHKETSVIPDFASRIHDTQFWAITNPETLTRYTDEFAYDRRGLLNAWDLMIVDESIMYKHRDSKRSKAINSMARRIDNVWLLSGGPATRYLDDMWHQFHILDNRGYGSYWRFAESYCRVDSNVWARTVVANKRDGEEMVKTNFEDIYFARSQEQVANIPDWLMVDIDLPMKPKQESVYEKLQKELVVYLEGHDDDEVITVDNRLGLILRSIQVASNPVLLGAVNSSGKWSALPELMDFYPGPYLVWINFIRSGEMIKEILAEKFGADRVALMNGKTPMEERNNIVDRFQASYLDVLVSNQAVGKFGFTLTKARTAIFVERIYDDGSYFQCLHRNRRIGTVQAPVVLNLRSVTASGNRTIDHVIHDCLDYRTGMMKKITIGNLRELIEE